MKLTETMMAYAFMKCPLCSETYRIKSNLRKHLNKEHTEREAERFIRKRDKQGRYISGGVPV